MITTRRGPCEEGTLRAVHPPAAAAPISGRWVLAATILGSTMAFIDESVVNVALPSIEGDLHVSVAIVQWIINAYTLALASLLLLGGAIGDQVGRRRVFVAGIAIFAAASLWCGLSPSVVQLLLARGAQGIGAALLIPSSLAIVGASFTEAERGRAIGTWAGFSALAGAAGPLIGGLIVDHASWRWIFLINPVVALPTIWAALRHVPESRDSEAKPGLDWPGTLLVFLGLGCLVFALIGSSDLGWRHPLVLLPLAAALPLLAAFLWVEHRSPAPIMPLDLFRSVTFSGINLMTLLLYAALGGAFFFLPFDLIQVHGYSAAQAGATFLPLTLIMGALSRWAGGLLDRMGARLPLIVGPAITSMGFALLALSGRDGAYWLRFLLPIVVLGFGMAVSVAPLTATVFNAVPTHRAGVASGINNAVATVASLLAVAVFGAIALAMFDTALDREIASTALSPMVAQALESARGTFVTDALTGLGDADRLVASAILRAALGKSVPAVMLIAGALALASAACAVLWIRPRSSPASGESR